MSLLCLLGAIVLEYAVAAPLKDVATEVEPGEFRRFDAPLPPGVENFDNFLRVTDKRGKALGIHGWSDSGHWDPERDRAYYLGLRKYQKFISFDERDGKWVELGWKGDAPARFERFGHMYGRTALDWRRGHYYRLGGRIGLYRYLIDEARWESLPGAPVQGYISMEWHYGLDKLVALGRGGHLHAYRDGTWTSLGRSAVDGYHSVARFNPKRRDMLVAGGNRTPRKVDLIDASGTVHHMRDAPFDILIKAADLAYDPASGNYLVLWPGKRLLYEFHPDRNEWKLAADWKKRGWPFPPDSSSSGLVPIPIDEYGVILWLHTGGPQLYRHKSVY